MSLKGHCYQWRITGGGAMGAIAPLLLPRKRARKIFINISENISQNK